MQVFVSMHALSNKCSATPAEGFSKLEAREDQTKMLMFGTCQGLGSFWVSVLVSGGATPQVVKLGMVQLGGGGSMALQLTAAKATTVALAKRVPVWAPPSVRS